jgi:hypothetical protein
MSSQELEKTENFWLCLLTLNYGCLHYENSLHKNNTSVIFKFSIFFTDSFDKFTQAYLKGTDNRLHKTFFDIMIKNI